MVSVSACVNLPVHHKVQKFSSGTGSLEWSQRKGRKMVVVVVLCITYILTLKWCGTGVIVSLQQAANDLHMVQLVPLPAHHLPLQKNPECLPFWCCLPRLSWKKCSSSNLKDIFSHFPIKNILDFIKNVNSYVKL